MRVRELIEQLEALDRDDMEVQIMLDQYSPAAFEVQEVARVDAVEPNFEEGDEFGDEEYGGAVLLRTGDWFGCLPQVAVQQTRSQYAR